MKSAGIEWLTMSNPSYSEELKRMQEDLQAKAARARAEAEARVAKLRAANNDAHYSQIQEERVLLRRLNEPGRYFCINGHVPKLKDQAEQLPTVCSICGETIVWDCDCGAALDLWYTYRPPYPKLVVGRDVCYACGRLCPWSQRWLELSGDCLDSYEELLLEHHRDYPSLESHIQRFLSSTEREEQMPVNLLQRLFGAGVLPEDPRHPRHPCVLAARRSFSDAVSEFRAQFGRQRAEARFRRAQLREKLEFWKSLSGSQFEQETMALLLSKGYVVERIGGAGDGGVDLIVTTNSGKVLVQCKAHAHFIGPSAVRDFYGAIVHHNATEGWLICLEGFSSAARQFAKGKPIKLYTVNQAMAMPSAVKAIIPVQRS